MDIKKIYSKIFEKFDDPKMAYSFMLKAYTLDKYKERYFPDRNVPKSLSYIYEASMEMALNALKNPENSVMVNIFFPCEILQAMDIYPLLVEGTAAFMTGSYTEKKFIDEAEKYGIPETYCSFHKIFIGGVVSNFFPKTKMVATTSLACDANINTFRHLSEIMENEKFILDIPYIYSEENLDYVEQQIVQCVNKLEEIFGRKMDSKKLREVLERENEAIRLKKKILLELSNKYIYHSVGAEMAKIFITTIGSGSSECLNYYKMLEKDLENAPQSENKYRIFWVHLAPFNDVSIHENFDINPKIQFLGSDVNLINLEELDLERPYRSLAKKLLKNHMNGPFDRKIEKIKELIVKLNADGVVNMCQWGCKQSSGGALLLKKEMEKLDIPFLILDGDSGDNRNNSKGQIKTRLEAFLEMIEKEKN